MRKILLTLFFILFAFPVYAYELLMAHNPGCGICQKFINEVAVDYNDSEASKTLPLIIISVYDQPEWFKEAYAENRIKGIRGTPTFIIWNGRKELARLVGYRNKEKWYEQINTWATAIKEANEN